MNYEAALDFLLERLPMFQRVGKAALKPDLSNTILLLEGIGNPHRSFKSVHIAGTNGKGTSAHAISAVLISAGYKTGLYTSPHLKSFTERIRIDGNEVRKRFVADFTTKNRRLIEQIQPSFFEVTVAMAFEYFRREEIDIAVVETGLGGRLDSTNVLNPVVSLITMIGFDHMDLLGDTLKQIAGEKAGIIKQDTPVVIGNNQADIRSVFENVARSKNAEIHFTDDYEVKVIDQQLQNTKYQIWRSGQLILPVLQTDLTAAYFAKNLPGILATIDVLRDKGFQVNQQDLLHGLRDIKRVTGIKGRMQVIDLDPLVIADIGHNEPGLIALFNEVKKQNKGSLHLIFGVVRDKELSRVLATIPCDANIYWTESKVPRSLPAKELQELAKKHGKEGVLCPDVNTAIQLARNQSRKDDLILICGSAFVVAEIEDL